MFKKLFSIMLTMLILNFSFLPVCAKTKKAEKKPIEKNIVISAHFVSDLDVNKSNIEQAVQFVSDSRYKTSQGIVIPKGTLFNGKITTMKEGRIAYRRANAQIEIDEMVLPDGKSYQINGRTKHRVLKGSMLKNVGKGIVGAPAAVVAGTLGGTVLLVEAVSIIGLVFVGPTSEFVGDKVSKLTNGVNCEKKKGESLPVLISLSQDFIDENLVRTKSETPVVEQPVQAENNEQQLVNEQILPKEDSEQSIKEVSNQIIDKQPEITVEQNVQTPALPKLQLNDNIQNSLKKSE